MAFIGWLWVVHNILELETALPPFLELERVGKLPTLPLTEEVSALPPPPHPKRQRQSRAEVSEINRIDWAFLFVFQ